MRGRNNRKKLCWIVILLVDFYLNCFGSSLECFEQGNDIRIGLYISSMALAVLWILDWRGQGWDLGNKLRDTQSELD